MKQEFTPTQMPLVYFEHETEKMEDALCVSKPRVESLKKGFKDIEDMSTNEKPLRLSEKIELALTLCQNEQERILATFIIGCSIGSQHSEGHGKKDQKIEVIGGHDIPEELKRMIMEAIIKNHFGNGKNPFEDSDNNGK